MMTFGLLDWFARTAFKAAWDDRASCPCCFDCFDKRSVAGPGETVLLLDGFRWLGGVATFLP